MYGFTNPFSLVRSHGDWITIAAHLVLGVSAVGVYKMLAQLQYAQPRAATNDR
jgi:hypothetical protein